MEIRFLGHAAFQLVLDGKVLYIDPWLTDNPQASIKEVVLIDKADYVLVSHEHTDHGINDAIKITELTGAEFVSVTDSAERGKDIKRIVGNTGGKIALDENITVHFTQAIHATAANQPCGFLIQGKEGVVYHAGDTALFSDMALIGKKANIDIALLPIGDVYTMGPEDAAKAVELLDCSIVVPMHYNTFPALTGTVEEFRNNLTDKSKLKVLEPGESFEVVKS